METAIVLAGMHRSGTSLLADLLGRAGVDMGERFVAANPHNPRGHFEDEDFVQLHDAILAANGTNWAATNCPETLRILPEHRARATEIVRARDGIELWGWKDPRTTLLLDFWRDLLPTARFIFVFRPAEQVVGSLRRRLDFDLLYQGRGAWTLHQLGLGFLRFRVQAAIYAWLCYNRAVIAFVERNRDVSDVMDLGKLPTHIPRLLRVMREVWGLPVRDVALDTVFERDLLHGDVPRRIRRACRARREVAEVEARLRALSEP